MPQTTSVTVSSHVMSEILSPTALAPLFSKQIMASKVNQASIARLPSKVRKIPKKTALAIAVDDVEGGSFANPQTLAYGSAISIMPTTKVQGANITMDALLLAMPGADREQCIAAVENNAPEAIPFLRDAGMLVAEAHLRRAEQDMLQLFPGLSESAGTTNTALGFSALLTGLFNVLDNNVEHENIVCVIEEKGVNDLRSALITGSGTGLATIWANPNADISLFRQVPDASRAGLRGSVLDIPVYAADKSLMSTANSNVDRVGGIFCLGRGVTAAPGSLRGFCEFTEGYAISLGFEFNLTTDDVDVIGRWKWAVAEHTDEHGCRLIYKKD